MILAILAFIAVIPPLVEYFDGNMLEVAFKYPPCSLPLLDVNYHFAVNVPLLLLSILSGVGLLKRKRGALFTSIALFVLVLASNLASSIVFVTEVAGEIIASKFGGSIGSYTSIAISLIGFYFLQRRDVKSFLR
jgi:hypothetical protein